jgi:hypothetical protein
MNDEVKTVPLWKRPEKSVRAEHQNKPIEEKEGDLLLR